MVSREDDKYVIWPAYFDVNLSREEGRKVPKALAVENPSLEKIFQIAKKMNLNPILEREARYPSRWWKKEGRVLVDRKGGKNNILKEIAKRLKQT